MNLVMQKMNLGQMANTKAFQVLTFIALAAMVVVLFAMLNGVFAITEAELTAGSTGATGGTNGAKMMLSEPTLWVLNFMKGTGGLLAALLGLLLTLYSAFVAKSLVGTMLSIGIAITALYGPNIILNFMGAIA